MGKPLEWKSKWFYLTLHTEIFRTIVTPKKEGSTTKVKVSFWYLESFLLRYFFYQSLFYVLLIQSHPLCCTLSFSLIIS